MQNQSYDGQAEKFFEKVWPSEGWYCVAIPSQFGYSHKVCQTIKQALGYAHSADSQGVDSYFAVGSLKAREVVNAEGKKQYRTHENIGWFRSFFVDIDCGEGKPYAMQSDGLQALKTFSAKVGLPKPIIVSSGGGIHAYWPLTEDVAALDWLPVAESFKRLAMTLNFEIDKTRVSDRSSVLRVPGTHNYKREEARPVKILADAEPITFQLFANVIAKNVELYGVSVPQHKAEPKFSADLLAKFGQNTDASKPASLEMIYAKCPQMARCREEGGSVGYQMRGNWVSIIKFTTKPDYEEVWDSDPQPEVVKSQTEAMLRDTLTDNPHTCASFEEANVGGCDDCRFKGKVKSPIVLGYSSVDVEVAEAIIVSEVSNIAPDRTALVTDRPSIAPTAEHHDNLGSVAPERSKVTEYSMFEAFDGNLMPLPPDPYLRSKQGGVMVDRFGDTGEPELLYEYDCYPIAREWDASENSEFVTILVRFKLDGYRQIRIPLEVMSDKGLFTKKMASIGILFSSHAHPELFWGYMNTYMKYLQGFWTASKNHPQLGWQEDGSLFVLPDKSFQNGQEIPSGVSGKVSESVRGFKKKGTLEAWVEVVNTYGRKGFEPHAFGHLVGYGSLLFQFTNYEGAIVNLVSPDSGSGKSTVLKTVETMFGQSKDMRMMIDDTINATMNRIGVYNSICPTLDEITNIEPETLSDFCYAISQGRAKNRLGASMTEAKNNSYWKSILLSSSNSNLMNKLSSFKQNAAPESYRVFEYYVNSTDLLTKEEAAEIFDDALNDNYGHAGEVFVKYVSANLPQVKVLIKEMRSRFDKAAQVPVRERYWSSVVACTLAGGIIAKRLNLCNFNIETLFKWTVDQVLSMRMVVTENKRDSKSLLVEYLNSTVGFTLTASKNLVDSKEDSVLNDDSRYSKLYNRYEVDKNLMYIDKTQIRKFLIDGGSDYTTVKKDLRTRGILLDESRNKVLTSGSGLMASGSTVCWLVDLSHIEMAGVKMEIVRNLKQDLIVRKSA